MKVILSVLCALILIADEARALQRLPNSTIQEHLLLF